MTWRVEGKIDGDTAWAEWDSKSGLLTSENALPVLQWVARIGPAPVTPTGPFLDGGLDDEKAAYAYCVYVLQPRAAPTGTPPALGDLSLADSEDG